MAITFLDEEDEIAPAAPTTGKRRITFLDEEEPPAKEAVKPEPEVLTTQGGRKITFLDEEPQAPSIGGLTVPPAPERPQPKPIVETIGQLEGIKNAAMNAFDSSRQSMAVAGGVSPEEAEDISRLEYQKEARKVSPAYSEYLQAEGMDAVKAFAKNPFEITTNIVAEGLAGSLYSLGAGVVAGGVAAAATAATGVGAPLAPAAFLGGQIGGTFAGSLATEYGGKVLEELQNAGMDIKDPESIQKFFGDEKLMESAKSQALKRGVPVAIFDGVSAGIGGRLARLPVQALTKTPTRLAVTEGVAQAALGGGGEIAGAVVAGEEIQPKAVFAEVLGEAGPAAAEITVGRIAERLAKTPEQKQFDQNVLATQVATRASQDIAPATADAVERQVQDTLASTAETPEQKVTRLTEDAKKATGIELEEETVARFDQMARSVIVPEIKRFIPEEIRNQINFIQDRVSKNEFKISDLDETQFKNILSPESYTKIVGLYEEDPQLATQTLRNIIDENTGLPAEGGGGEEEGGVGGKPTINVSELPQPKQGFIRLYHGGAGETAGEFTPDIQYALGYAKQSKGSIFYVDVPEDSEFLVRGNYDERGNISDRGMLTARQNRVPDDIAFTAKRAASGFESQPVTPPVTPTPEAAVAPVEPVVPVEGAPPLVTQEVVPEEQKFNNLRESIGATNRLVGDVFGDKIVYSTVTEEGRPEAELVIQENAEIPNRVILETIFTPPELRGRGLANEKMQGLIQNVDRLGMDVQLSVDPEAASKGVEGESMTRDQLKDWYRKYGFFFAEDSDLGIRASEATKEQLRAETTTYDPAVHKVPNEDNFYSDSETLFNVLDQNPERFKEGEVYAVDGDSAYVFENGDLTEIRDVVFEYNYDTEKYDVKPLANIISPEAKFETAAPEAATAVTPPAEVAPTPETALLPETPNLEPLRRVARAEQTEEDVSGLVGQGLVELYNGQPVITQAGLETLPETERPRLNPEARKIQIDTGSNEVVAEAIVKNLRIGVDQVGTGVRMPAGWTLVEDIYVPPKPMERITEFTITPEYDVEETANVFATVQKVVPPSPPQAPAPEVRESRREQPVVLKNRFYSQLERVVAAKMPNVSSPEQLKAIIDPTRGSGVKPEEIKWSGITEAIDRIASENNGRVPKEAIIKYMQDEGRVKFEEVRLSDAAAQNEMRLKRFRDSQKVMRDAGIFVDVSSTGEVLLRDKYSGPPNVDPENLTPDLRREYETLQDNAIEDRAAERLETRHSKYQLAEGTNYREVVMAMPFSEQEVPEFMQWLNSQGITNEKLKTMTQDKRQQLLNRYNIFTIDASRGDYTSTTHYPNVPNYVAHMRLNDRKDSDGKEGTFIEEIQSDRHQAGREKGYREDQIGKLPKNWSVKQRGESWIVVDEYGEQIGPLQSTEDAAIQEGISQANFNDINVPSLESGGIPDAPFRKDWPLQMFKRALEEAVSSGKEWIGWTTGETQADRYDLSKQVESIRYFQNDDGTFDLQVYGLEGGETPIIEKSSISKQELADTIGKDLATQAAEGKGDKYGYAGWRGWEGDGLKIGGEGMIGFYDNILPKEIAKYVKKWDGQVEKGSVLVEELDKKMKGFGTMWSTPDDSYRIWKEDNGEIIVQKFGRDGYVDAMNDKDVPVDVWDKYDELSKTNTKQIPIWRVNITPEMRRIVEEEGQALFSLQMPSRGAGMETEAVATKLESLGFKNGGIVSVVNEPDASFEGRTIIRDGKVVGIELNAAALKDDAAIERVLNHEIAESANADGALNNLVAGLTPKERKEINDAITRLGYAEKARTAEEAARAVELLAEGWRGRRWFERAVARVEAWANKLGYKLTRRAAEYIAARNMAEVNDSFRKRTIADALANLKGARKVNFNGLSAVLIPPSEMEFAYSIAAYHGTPHEIKDGFQLKYIGTGEGAQAFGWGLYFAEKRGIAEGYRERLSRGGVDIKKVDESRRAALESWEKFKTERPEQAQNFREEVATFANMSLTDEDIAVELQNAIDGYRNFDASIEGAEKARKVEVFRPDAAGAVYTVELDVDPDDLLSWDKPISAQSQKVLTMLRNTGWTDKGFNLVRQNYGNSGDGLYSALTDDLNSKQRASEALLAAGIKGIRYLDQGSRYSQPKKTGFGWMVDDYRGTNYFETKQEAEEFAAKGQTYNFVVFDENLIKITARDGESVDIRESRREDAIPTFSEGSPEASTLSTMEASMAKVDEASEGKPNPENKPTYKISEIASVWMDQGGDVRQLQDLISENTNLTPTNAAKVAKVIAKQYDKQQQIAEAVLETEAGVTLEGLPDGMEIPKDVDPKNKRTVLQRVIDATTGVRVKPVILQVPEKTALKEQIRLKARETREAKKAQQETADSVVEAIKALELRGPMRAKQAQALAKRAAKVIWTSEKSMENFMAYAERVMANTNYDADLREAKAAQKRAKELSKRDSIAAPQRETLEAISNIGINLLNDPREFADVVNHYLRSFKPVVSEAYVVVPDAEMKSYLSAAEDVVNEAKAEFEVEDNERLADKYGITIDELKKYMDAEEIMDALVKYAKREVIEGILNEKSAGVKEALKGVDTTILRADQRKLIDSMKVIDVKSLDSAEKQAYIRIGNNIIFNNNQTNGAEFFVATAKGQQSARDLAKNTEAMTKNKAWSNIVPALGSRRAKKVLKAWAEDLQSVADTFRNAFGKEAMTVFYEAMGMVDLDLGFTNAARTLEEIQSKMEKFYKKLDKKYKGAATNQDGILSEGIVGYLIQNVPEKGEADSLAQRRGLLQQDIIERRKSGDEDRMQMADRIQELMRKLDGETVDQILANLKREYPANYESLTWLKDELFPQYKDFLKQFDENFNDQANNYNTPNYLPIVYSNISPSIDLLQGKKKYYDSLSPAPKQSSYTIKRSDYTQLPIGDDGRKPKEIGLNLRRNAYNSLSDQITRAYTNPARQRIYSFLKTPESEEALGGAANRDFFAERIERLMESRERRGSFNKNAFEKAVDVLANLGRDIGTRIALAGSYQLIRQPADQVTVAIGVTGRADLMAKHLDPRQIKAARPVIDLFSIGRRGDASSGYKYINQMEGAQSRLERYYTEGNWVKAKEAAKNFADKFMAPLKVSDFTVAAATWMTFYRAYLAKNGIKFTTWEDAANLIKSDDVGHKRAAAYAENMTDIYQGSSDPTKMAVFAQKGKTGPENLLKAILVPFNSFGVQFRSRISSELTEIFTRSGDWRGKAIAVKDLGATIGGTIMFGLAKRFVLPAITLGGVQILYSIFGVDVEEPDEEKKKEEFELKWRQLQGDIISTMIVGGGGQMLESYTIDGMNYLKYMIDSANGSEDVLDDNGEVMSFNKYAKERAPFYRYRSFDNAMSLGILDIGMDQARKAVLNTKMVLTPEEMERFTPEEQRFLLVGLISDWLYLGGFNDADFARMWEKGRRDMINARKEEEKALKKIREGR